MDQTRLQFRLTGSSWQLEISKTEIILKLSLDYELQPKVRWWDRNQPRPTGQSPLIITGPYLVRSAPLTNTNMLNIRADFNQSTVLDLSRGVNTVTVELLGVCG